MIPIAIAAGTIYTVSFTVVGVAAFVSARLDRRRRRRRDRNAAAVLAETARIVDAEAARLTARRADAIARWLFNQRWSS